MSVNKLDLAGIKKSIYNEKNKMVRRRGRKSWKRAPAV